jgi:hypothetical protein
MPRDEDHDGREDGIEHPEHRGDHADAGTSRPVRETGTGAAADAPDSDPVADIILGLVAERGPGKSICVSEAARAAQQAFGKPGDDGEAWRRYLPGVRQQAKSLARQGRLRILRKGRPVDPHQPIKGVIRLAAVRGDSEAG